MLRCTKYPHRDPNLAVTLHPVGTIATCADPRFCKSCNTKYVHGWDWAARIGCGCIPVETKTSWLTAGLARDDSCRTLLLSLEESQEYTEEEEYQKDLYLAQQFILYAITPIPDLLWVMKHPDIRCSIDSWNPSFYIRVSEIHNILSKRRGNMKKILAISFLFVFASFAAGQAEFLQGPLDDAFAKAKNEGKMVLIDFFSDG